MKRISVTTATKSPVVSSCLLYTSSVVAFPHILYYYTHSDDHVCVLLLNVSVAHG